MSRIPFEQLLALATGELDEPTTAALQRQIDQSPEAAEALRRVQTAIRTMRTDDSVAPPTDVLAQAKTIFARLYEPAQRRGWLEGLREIVASLVYDSRMQPVAVGFRSAHQPVQLSYSAAGVTVDLQVDAATGSSDATRNVMGQVSLPPATPRMRIRLYRASAAAPIQESPVDESGMFAFTLTAGHYDMAICTDEWAMVIPDLQVD